MIRRLPCLTALLLLGCCGLASAQITDNPRRASPSSYQSQSLRGPADQTNQIDASGRVVRAPGRGRATTLAAPGEGGMALPDTRPPSRWTRAQ